MIRLLIILAAAGTVQAHPREPDVSFLSEKAQTVLAQTKALHEKIHEKVEAENESSTSTWKDLGRSLHEACLIGRGPGRGPGPGGHKPEGKRPGPMTDEQKKEFETKLTSDTCSQAIASAQGKLQ